ncbi:27-O-demethylrifamycin SV methyltransferase [soil metagenome]
MEHTQDYDDRLVALLEVLWGDGYLSPGGDHETALVLDGLDLRGKRVLDLGCGTGGSALFIASQFDPEQLIGVDIEAGVVTKAIDNAAAAGLDDRTSFLQVDPGPLPFPDGCFDVVFSKDAIVHIGNKQALAHDVFRVLAPAGVFAASDWMSGSDAPASPALAHYQEIEGLGFGLASPNVYFAALRDAGFEQVSYLDRSAWLAARSHVELEDLDGRLRPAIEARVGRAFLDHEVEVWKAMCAVFDTGELGAGHWRAIKP